MLCGQTFGPWWRAAIGETDPSLSSALLGGRLLALSAVAGAAVLIPSDRVDRWLLVIGVIAGAATGCLQHLWVRRRRFSLAACLIVPQAALWSLLIHATGGRASPFIVGYLLELPLSGLLFGRVGLLAAAIAVSLSCLVFPEIFPRTNRGQSVALWLGVIAIFSVLSARLVSILRRRREQTQSWRRALSSRADAMREERRLLLESLNGTLLGIDESGRIESLNPSGARMLGLQGVHAVGKPWQEVLRIDGPARERILETLAIGTTQRAVPMTVEALGNDRIAVRAEIWPSPGSDGRRTYVLLDPDLSENPEDPVRRLGEAAASVAHQIKNTVHALQGMVETVDRGGAPSRGGEVTNGEYLEGLRSLGVLAEDVLAFSGTHSADMESLSIQDALRAAVVFLGKAPIRVCVPESPLPVIANRSQLVHSIFNLLDNARRVTPQGSHVEVCAKREDDWVTLEIIDQGPGISAAVMAARGPVPSVSGAGLGLMTARRFLERSRGLLSIMAVEGGGTRCRLALPFAGSVRPGPEAKGSVPIPVPVERPT